MSAPLGVLSRADGTVVLVYDEWAVPPDALREQIERQQAATPVVEPLWGIPAHGVCCDDPDCGTFGCWAASFPEGETFHCCECRDPFDAAYQCLTQLKLCPGCCGHPACAEQAFRRLGVR